MFDIIKNDLINLATQKQLKSDSEFSAINILFYKLIKSDYFNDAYKDFVLLKRSENYYQVNKIVEDKKVEQDPLSDLYYDEISDYYDYEDLSDNEYEALVAARIHKPKTPESEQVHFSTNAEINKLVENYLKEMIHTNPVYEKLLNPDIAFIDSRYSTLKIEKFENEEFLEKLNSLLGDQHDTSLKHHFLKYFNNRDNRYLRSTKAPTYFMAYNDNNEIAGLLSIQHYQKNCHALSYVTVAPSFREKGISTKLYQVMIENCINEKAILVRSSPGEFTRENPKITQRYENMLKQNDILHTSTASSGYLLKVLCDCYDTVGYHNLYKLGKKICDRNIENSHYLRGNEEQQLAEELKAKIINFKNKIKNQI